MNLLPTVLIAGGEEVLDDLSAALPPETCTLVYTESAAQTLEQANGSAVLVVDERLPGAVELCQRLRADPVTAAVPIVLRSQRAVQVPQHIADAAVLAHDIGGLVHVVRELLPSDPALAPEAMLEEFDQEDLFDDAEATVIWRRPEDEDDGTDQGWPPPPPFLKQGQDLVEFSLSFAGYMNSLIEALEDPSKLTPDEHERLREATKQTISYADQCLAQVQNGVNEALMGKDLERMKVLSSAKNSLYEKLQRMRKLAAELKPLTPSRSSNPGPGPRPEPQKPGPQSPDAALEELGLPTRRAPGKKSQITLAAEAKEAAQRAQQRAAVRRPPASRTARKNGATEGRSRVGGPTWLWIVIAVVAVGGSATYVTYTLAKKNDNNAPVAQGANTPPRMTRVELKQTPAGIHARPMAVDGERDRISFSFQWFRNGNPVAGAKTARLSRKLYKPGESVEVVVTPRDAYAKGAPMRSRPFTAGEPRRHGPRRRPVDNRP